VQREAATFGSTASLLLSLPLSLGKGADPALALKAAHDLRRVDDVDLNVIDGGVRIQQMAATIRQAVADLLRAFPPN